MLDINNVSKKYNLENSQTVEVLRHINLTVKHGEFIAFLGPNGCGKTTLLEIISKLIKPSKGRILFGGRENHQNYNTAMVFQDYRKSLLPWLSAKENILFPLKLKKINRLKQERRLLDICSEIDTSIDFNQYPYQLSGGQQQMVSILRGLIVNPDLFLLDEPFSSLDYQSKLMMLQQLHNIWLKKRISTIYVSHDIDEAIFLAQKIVLLSKKPTRILKVFKNPLFYPRNISIIGSPSFAVFKNEILSLYLSQI